MKIVTLSLLTAAIAFAQQGQQSCATVSRVAAKLEFDAASVKPAGPFKAGPVGIFGGPGSNDRSRVTAPRVALATLIGLAYDLMGDQLTGPDWMRDARNNGFAISATLPATSTKEEYCGMLRNLVASRFHVTFHRETQPRPAYELTVLPGGPKFRKYDPNAAGPETEGPGVSMDRDGFAMLNPKSPTANIVGFSPNGEMKLSFRNDVSAFARTLGEAINRSNGVSGAGVAIPRVIDKTGLIGVYDIHLQFAGAPFSISESAGPAVAPDPADIGPNIFNAVQQQLGLKLTKVKDVQVDVLIIDHVDQTPTDN